MQPPDSCWRLYAPAPEDLVIREAARPAWVQEFKAGPSTDIDEIENFYPVPGVAPASWRCFVLPDYILSHSFVAALQAEDGRYAMLFFQKVGPQFRQQDRPAQPALLGWFMFALTELVESRAALESNLRQAVSRLQEDGLLSHGIQGDRRTGA